MARAAMPGVWAKGLVQAALLHSAGCFCPGAGTVGATHLQSSDFRNELIKIGGKVAPFLRRKPTSGPHEWKTP